jgi:hypothetical protein
MSVIAAATRSRVGAGRATYVLASSDTNSGSQRSRTATAHALMLIQKRKNSLVRLFQLAGRGTVAPFRYKHHLVLSLVLLEHVHKLDKRHRRHLVVLPPVPDEKWRVLRVQIGEGLVAPGHFSRRVPQCLGEEGQPDLRS